MTTRTGSRRRVVAGLITSALVVGVTSAVSAPETASAAGTVNYTYDADGQLTSVTDTSGARRNFSYDAVGNLLGITAGAPSANQAQTMGVGEEPAIGGIHAAYVTVGGRPAVRISGDNLPEKSLAHVKIGGLVSEIGTASSTGLVAFVPPGVGGGKHSVTVAGGNGRASTAVTLPGSQVTAPRAEPVSPPLQAQRGVTAVAGRVLDSRTSLGLAEIELEIDGVKATSQDDGRFLLAGVEPGHHELEIDAADSNRGVYEVGVDAKKGRTTALKWNVWLTKLDTAHAVRIPHNVTHEIVVTNPSMPGLEVHVPQGTTMTDDEGKQVNSLSLTKLPVDRQPFPGAPGMTLAWTIQPGDVEVHGEGLEVVYPNLAHQLPGTRIDYVDHDADRAGQGWEVYGHGRVTADGQQIQPDKSTRLHETYQLGVSYNPLCRFLGPFCPRTGDNSKGGDPVDLQTGLFVSAHTDLTLDDVVPLDLTRTYRQNDYVIRSFGMGQSDAFNSFVAPDNNGNYVVQFPDGSSVPFAPSGVDDNYVAVPTPSGFTGGTMRTDFHRYFVVTLANGQVYTFDGETASLVSIADRYGDTETLDRDSRGRVARVTSPNGRWISLTWGTCTSYGAQCVIGAQDNLGRSVSYSYDDNGRMLKATDAAKKATTYAWVPCDDPTTCTELTSITDPKGITYLTNEFDANGRVRRQQQADGSVFTFTYTLDGNGSTTSTLLTDPRGNQRQTTFDANGYTSSDTSAYGTALAQTTSYTRDSAFRVTKVTDPLGRKTAITYDSLGNVLTSTSLSGTANAVTDTMTYEPAYQRVASAKDPLGRTTTFTYDDDANTVTATDPLGHQATVQTEEGQPVEVTDAAGNVTDISYLDGQPVTVVDPLGRASRSYFDAAGRPVKTTDPMGHRTKYVLDVMDRMVKTVDPLGQSSSATYDANGNVLTTTDALGHATTYAYDSMDRVASIADAIGKRESWTYDPSGNVASSTDKLGVVDTYAYDGLDRVTTTGFKKNGTTFESTIKSTYDAGNRITKLVDSANGTITLGYDSLDRTTSETTPQGSVTYSYDSASRRTGMTVAGQPATTYSYDNADRLTGISGGVGTTSMTYDANDRATSVTLPSGVKESYTRDASGQVTGISYDKGGTNLGTITYGYDAAGRRTSVGGSYARTGLPAVTTGPSTYNAVNALMSRGSKTYTYDDAGQMTSDGTNTYTYNARHELTGVAGSSTASFTYDGLGRRQTKKIASTTTGFVYDGSNVVQEKSGSTVTANLLTGFGMDETFARNALGTTSSLLMDALGSTIGLTDSAGTVQTSYTYDPFGATTSSGAANSNPVQFAGRENDGVAGMYFNRSRYYSPGQERFTSQDPAGAAGSGANLYAYAGNSPTNATDPTGQFVQLIAGCAIGGAVEIGLGWFESHLQGRKYTAGDAIKDGAVGCVTGAVGVGLEKAAVKGFELLRASRVASGAANAEAKLAPRLAQTCMNSFTGDTLVLMADGSKKPIKDVKLGDWVMATDPITGQRGPRQVLDLIRHSGPHTMVLIGLSDGSTIDATDQHPFWVANRGDEGAWVDAIDLEPGDQVETADGGLLTVESTGIRVRDLRAFNLTVNDLHTYYVGDDEVLVHNAGCTNIADLPTSAVRNLTQDSNYGFSRLNLNHGVTRVEFREQIHYIKRTEGLPADFDLSFGPTGDVWNPQTGDLIGSIVHGG